MDEKNRELLSEEIDRELRRLGDLTVGTDDYIRTVDGVSKLIDRATTLKKMEIEDEERINERARKTKESSEMLVIRRQELSDQRKDRMLGHGIAIAGILIPALITIWGTLKSLKFEEEGTVTTTIGRGFIGKLLPKK